MAPVSALLLAYLLYGSHTGVSFVKSLEDESPGALGDFLDVTIAILDAVYFLYVDHLGVLEGRRQRLFLGGLLMAF